MFGKLCAPLPQLSAANNPEMSTDQKCGRDLLLVL